MNTATDAMKTQTAKTSGGRVEGQSASDLLGFFGATPITQPTSAAQAAITDGSGGTAAPTTGVATVGASYSQTVLANALATIIAEQNAIRLALVNLGLIKGS